MNSASLSLCLSLLSTLSMGGLSAPISLDAIALPPMVQMARTAPNITAQDTTLVPGERVGPISKNTSRADLAALYGEAALEDMQIPVGEGFSEAGTVVNGGSDRAFSIIWTDATRTRPLLAKDFGPAWQTAEGLRVGLPWAAVQSRLGNFKIYGFGWDYGGTVVLEGSALSQYYGLLLIRMEPSPSAAQAHPEALRAVSGDRLFESNNPNLAIVEPSISNLTVYLNSLAQ